MYTAGCRPTVSSWTPTRRSCFGVPLLAVSTNCHNMHSGLGRMTSFHPRRHVTLVFSLTLTSACGLTFSGLSPAALPSCTNCVSAIVCFPNSNRQSCADETRLRQHYVGWFTDQPAESPPVGSQCCSSVDRRSTSLRSRHWHLQFFTGFVLLSASISNWRSLYTDLCTALHRTSIPVWASLPCCSLAVSSSSTVGNLQPTQCAPVASHNCWRPFIWLCWAKALEQSPWWHYIGLIAVSFQKETENSLIPAIIPGPYFVACYSFCVAIVVLEVNCYLGHVKKCNVM